MNEELLARIQKQLKGKQQLTFNDYAVYEGAATYWAQFWQWRCFMGQKDMGSLLPSHTTERIGAKLKPFSNLQVQGRIYDEGGETLAHLAQRSGGCPIRGTLQGQVGRGSEQPDPVEGVPAHCRVVGLDDL